MMRQRRRGLQQQRRLLTTSCLFLTLLSNLFTSASGFVSSPAVSVLVHSQKKDAAPLLPSSLASAKSKPKTAGTQLQLFARFLRNLWRTNDDISSSDDTDRNNTVPLDSDQNNDSSDDSNAKEVVPVNNNPTSPPTQQPPPQQQQQTDVVIVGAGVSGLTAALRISQDNPSKKDVGVVVLEATSTVGGRVQSDITPDGFVLDRGFAVFLEAYPAAQQVLDYPALGLRPLLPGALIQLPSQRNHNNHNNNHGRKMARVADPIRKPRDLLAALFAPVGSFRDKLRFIPLIWMLRTKSVETLFAQPETTTQTALTERWKFSRDMQQAFWEPFLEGVFLTSLEQQSSHMFSFVMKMFTQGSGCLPTGGMGVISQQLATQARQAGAQIYTQQPVESVILQPVQSTTNNNNNSNNITTPTTGSYLVQTVTGNRWHAKSVIIATDNRVAHQLLSQMEGLEALQNHPVPKSRGVGCLYYSFPGPPPVEDPILILNGCGSIRQRNTKDHPINNICFPSVINPSYAPKGYSLCSVAVLNEVLELYTNNDDALDQAVRRHLGSWFPDYQEQIENGWKLRRVYRIPNAQPSQSIAGEGRHGLPPATTYGGRPCDVYCGYPLPSNLYVCGDHMATASLNGAMESGLKAARAVLDPL